MRQKDFIQNGAGLIILPFFQNTVYIGNKIACSPHLLGFQCCKQIVVLSGDLRFPHLTRLTE